MDQNTKRIPTNVENTDIEDVIRMRAEIDKINDVFGEVKEEFINRLSDEKLDEQFVTFGLNDLSKEQIARFQNERDRVALCIIQEVRRHQTICKVAPKHLTNIALRAAVRILTADRKEAGAQ